MRFHPPTPRLPLLNALWLVSCLIATGMAAPRTAAAAAYYVSATGSDTYSGTQNRPFRQIRKALALVKAGDTVLVSNGKYLGFTLAKAHGTAAAPITIQATGAKVYVTRTSDRWDNRDTMLLTSCSYIVLDGLNAFYGYRSGIRIDASPNITIRNGVYAQNNKWGIFTDFSDNLLIENNECFGSHRQHGIYVSNTCTAPTVRGNLCHDNRDCGIQMNADKSQGGAGLITGALIEDNVVYNNGLGGGAAINLDGVQNSVVVNNLLFNNHASGIMNWQGNGAAGPSGMQILHNTVVMPVGSRWGLTFLRSAGLNVARNNILLNSDPVHGGLAYGSAADVANTDSAYNIVDRITPDNWVTVLTLAQWQAKGYEPHSFNALLTSLFVNPAAGNYHLLPTAPAIDTGQTLSNVTVDLDGWVRPVGAASDIGCYEWHS